MTATPALRLAAQKALSPLPIRANRHIGSEKAWAGTFSLCIRVWLRDDEPSSKCVDDAVIPSEPFPRFVVDSRSCARVLLSHHTRVADRSARNSCGYGLLGDYGGVK